MRPRTGTVAGKRSRHAGMDDRPLMVDVANGGRTLEGL
jgi:hypothetical protein